MGKSHFFSIFLLKAGHDFSNSLKDDHSLELIADATNLPQDAKLYILDAAPRPPWWKRYFGISRELIQGGKGAIIFLPASGRWFALTFGHVFHNLKDDAYEYDFGLKVTLNCVDPKLRSTDTVDPGTSKRQRTQMPVDADLTYFDFDKDASVLRKLTGKVKEEYAGYFKSATGSSSLHINSDMSPNELVERCEHLLEIYKKDDYKEVFPNIRDIEPVRDPALVDLLNSKLIAALRARSSDVSLTIPEIVDYQGGLFTSFSGAGSSPIYSDVSMLDYHAYLEKRQIRLEDVDAKMLKAHRLQLCDEVGLPKQEFPIYKCLLCDVPSDNGGPAYHLCDGNWYCIDKNFVTKLKTDLDPYFSATELPELSCHTEGEYNRSLPGQKPEYICLDEENISPARQSQVEPCDLYSVSDDTGVLVHLKISTRSAQLSHLFNQGLVAVELLKSEPESKKKMLALVEENLNGNDKDLYLAPVNTAKYKLVFVIATRKEITKKSDNLPMFSRVALRRIAKTLRYMSVPLICSFIADKRVKPGAKEKPRKKREAGVEEVE